MWLDRLVSGMDIKSLRNKKGDENEEIFASVSFVLFRRVYAIG